MALLQDGEHPLQGRPQVQRRAEGLADLEQVGQLARVGAAGRHRRDYDRNVGPSSSRRQSVDRAAARPGGRLPQAAEAEAAGAEEAAAERARVIALNQPWAMTW